MVTGDGDADPELKALRKKLNAHRKARPKLLRTMIMHELPEPRVSYIHLGGDFTRKGAAVKPGVLGVLNPLETTSPNPNRLDLAKWLVDKRNPLDRSCDRESHVAEVLRQRASSIPRAISARKATSRLIRNCSTGSRSSSWTRDGARRRCTD